VPGLGQLPVVGRLFSDHNGDHVKTEIVLQITPHIVRPQLTMDSDTRELWSGTDTNVRTEQLRLDPSRPVASSATGAPALPYTPVKPGQVGGGTMGPPPAASGSAATAPKSAFGQPPPPMRTTPPPAPYNGRFSGTPAVPQGSTCRGSRTGATTTHAGVWQRRRLGRKHGAAASATWSGAGGADSTDAARANAPAADGHSQRQPAVLDPAAAPEP
jgi:general secretion pathway protein D